MADISAQPVLDMGQLLSSYGQNQANIGLTQAQTQGAQAGAGLTRAQTGLVGMQTQKAAFEVQMIRKAMQALENVPTGQSEKSGEASIDPTEAGVATSLTHKFFVDPMGPPGLQQYINGTAWVNPAEAQRAEEWRKTLVASQTAKNQNEASEIWQTSNSLAGGNMDHPLSSLLSLRPGSYLNNVGKAIASDPNKSPEEKDATAAVAIKAAAKYSYLHTGKKAEMAGDQPVDEQSKLPLAATPRAPLSNQQNIDLTKFNATPQTATTDNRTSTIYPGVRVGPDGKPIAPQGTNGSGAKPRQLDVNNSIDLAEGLKRAGFRDDQISFVKDQPAGMSPIKGNQQLNETDKEQRQTYIEQRKKLAADTNIATARAQDSLTHIKQIQGLMNTPGLTFGPGSHEYAQMQTFLNQWVGTSAGQAGAYQVLSKVLNASEMNDLLQQFHSEGAQVRLGAYESRLIMEKLAANPNLTKEAVDQMLRWQASDAQYSQEKARVAGAVIATNKSVENFDKNYAAKYPKQDTVDTSVADISQRLGHKLNFSGAKGKTYNTAEVTEAARQAGMPLLMFEDQLRKAGATIK